MASLSPHPKIKCFNPCHICSEIHTIEDEDIMGIITMHYVVEVDNGFQGVSFQLLPSLTGTIYFIIKILKYFLFVF